MEKQNVIFGGKLEILCSGTLVLARLAAVFAGCLSVLAPMAAQTSTGAISGTAFDPSGRVVPEVSITLINSGTNEVRKTLTNGAGHYAFPLLPPAIYRLEGSAAGFKRVVHESIRLEVALDLDASLRLEIGQTSEVVTVSASTTGLESESATIGHLMDNQRLIELPTNGRNSYGFAALLPGVRASAGFSQVAYGMYNDQFVSINGSRPNQNGFYLDGGINSEPAFNGPGIFPALDSVEEYKVQTHNYSSEFTNAAGGVINVVTKSGTNSFHGSLYEFLRNDQLTANNFFLNAAGQPRAPFRYNQFGGSFGGPVIIPKLYRGTDRTFFFVSYEGLRWSRGLPTTATVPSDLQRVGDFSKTLNAGGGLVSIYDPVSTRANPDVAGQSIRTQFPGNIIPANRMDAVARNLVAWFPHANTAGTGPAGINNFISDYSGAINKNTFALRLDQAISDRQKLFGRISLNNTTNNRPGLWGPDLGPSSSSAGDDTYNQRQAVINYNNILSPSFVLELSSSYVRYSMTRITEAANFDPVKLGFPTYLHQLQPALVSCFPALTIAGYSLTVAVPDSNSGYFGYCGFTLSGYDTFHEAANLRKTAGAHSFRFGGDFGENRLNSFGARAQSSYSFATNFTQGPNPLTASSTAGYGFASFLLGTGSGSITSDSPGQSIAYKYFGLYFQDDWKPSKRLTVNLGLRWDHNAPWTERYNRVANFDFTAANPLAAPNLPLRGGLTFPATGGLPRGQYNAEWRNFAPRAGIAFQASKSTVLRAGFGIFFAPMTGGGFNSSAVPASGYSTSTSWVGTLDNVTPASYLSNPYPSGFVRAPGNTQGLATLLGQSVTALDRNRSVPYSEQWNLNLQQLLPAKLLLDLAYVGSRGVHLFGNLNYNQLPDSALSMGTALNQLVANPFYGLISTGTLSSATVARSQLLRPFPQFTGVTISNEPYGASTYHALEAKLERRFSAGLSMLVSYTFSKLIDNVAATTTGFPGEAFGTDNIQNYNNLAAERAIASFDTPHSLSISANYALPFGPGRKLLNLSGAGGKIVGGWQLNAISVFSTGAPLGLTTASNTLYNSGGSERPNWNAQDPSLPGSASSKLTHYFNTGNFSQPAAFTYGNAGRFLTSLRAPGVANLDLSLFKNVQLHERLTLQFRAEAFNLPNRVQFAPPGAVIGSSSAGVISSQQNSPRDIQFGLKLLF